ncbi:hypothetical protein OGAPHI_001320 [Ogataea philodendri]|uniref:Uncharacterized protein n=1 Tax=Ogataea philodendri TaxID=1378263 RepID=A0A9P8T9N9_9ASCO|nr:uncharacterized protein OGAPHI_001320 [Ogataea philodendri]KAH3670804.1 hypothetical protein OGAPHI_001320 [Ogataea philodendri]
MTRPDITYAVNCLARFSTTPDLELFKQLYHLIIYLYHTRGNKMTYKAGDCQLSIYTHSDLAQDVVTRKSIGGHIFAINGSPFSWDSKRISTICDSSCQAEMESLSIAVKELFLWFIGLLEYTGLIEYIEKKPIVHVDNSSVISLIKKGN